MSSLVFAWRKFLDRNSLLRHYLWKYRKFVVIGLGSLLMVDVLEVLPPFILKKSIDALTEGQPLRRLAQMAFAYFGVSLLQGVGRYGWRMYLIRASMFSGRDIRQRYTEHLFGLSASFFDRRRIGDLMSLATNDVEAVRMAMGAGLLTLADAFFYFLTVPIAMYLLSPKLTLLAFVPLPFIPWFVMRNQQAVHSRFEKVQNFFSKLAAMAQENLNGIRVIKAFAREDAQIRRFRAAGEEFVGLNMHLARVQTAFGPILDFTMSMGLVLLLFIGGRGVIDGAVTLGTFVAFQRYIQKMVWPMTALGMALAMHQRAIASSGRIKEIFSVQSDVPQPKIAQGEFTQTLGGARGKVEFRKLSFSFPGTQEIVLSDVDLTIEPGERVAFVGTIGAGKSALLSLLPRLYPAKRGMLWVDGIDVNDWPIEELRRQVGYVGQEVFLFSETVTENIAFGLHNWMAESGQLAPIEEATRLAAVHEDVLNLVEGYHTRLGERGVNLSGGQKQRVTIARALIKQPAILVLDDALSSVDVQTEEKILKSLRSRVGRNTEIIAAHRISTVRDADRIVVLQEGRVFESGVHAKLMRANGTYRKFYDEQRLKEDLDQFIQKYEEKKQSSGDFA